MASIFESKSVALMIMMRRTNFFLKKEKAEKWQKFVEEEFPWIKVELIDMEGGDYLPSFECDWSLNNPYTLQKVVSEFEIQSLHEELIHKFYDFQWEPTDQEVDLVKQGNVKAAIKLVLERLQNLS